MQPPPRLPFASFSASPSDGSLQLVGPNLGTPRQSATTAQPRAPRASQRTKVSSLTGAETDDTIGSSPPQVLDDTLNQSVNDGNGAIRAPPQSFKIRALGIQYP
jgi:hypothetical protein